MLCEDNKSFVLCFSVQSKTQECYANLSLKAPRLQSGRSSPQIQYSDVVHLEEPTESEKDDEGNMDALSTMSDLYASVQTQRAKTVDTADGGEGYANHLWGQVGCGCWDHLCAAQTCNHKMALFNVCHYIKIHNPSVQWCSVSQTSNG